MRAGLLLALFAVFWVALFPPAAIGATAHAEFGEFGGLILHYVAEAGESNQVEVTHTDASTTIHDSGAVITAGPRCTSVNANEVSCPDIDLFVSVLLGDGDDDATVVEQAEIDGFIGIFVSGDTGSDELSACGNCSSTSLFGRGGNDMLTGNPRRFDKLSGGAGDDTITGGNRRNPLLGGGGDDTIAAGAGPDVIDPGSGEDNVDGGLGVDTVSYETLSAPVVVDLRTGQATGGGDEDTLVSITNISGTRFSDRLIGDGRSNLLSGERGPDELIGGGGDDALQGDGFHRRLPSNDDRLFGGAGNDELDGGQGGDLLVGGPGQDRFRGQGGDDRIRARDGTRDFVHGGPHLDRASVDRLDEVEGIEIFF